MGRPVMCSLFGHKVRRDRLRWQGEDLVGRCRWCRTRMERDDHGNWRAATQRQG